MAAGGAGYFGSNYWASNYWATDYWAEEGAAFGGFWADRYWAADYWAANYWALPSGGIGEVLVTDDAKLTLNDYVVSIKAGPDILSTTEVLALTSFDTDSNVNVDPPINTPALTLTAISLGVGTSGYVLGDIQLQFLPNSTITITEGMVPDTLDRSLLAYHPTTNAAGDLDIGIGPPAHLALDAFDVIANNNVIIEPLPQSLTLTEYDSPAAGIGWLIQFATQSRSLTGIQASITGIPVANIRVNAVRELQLTGITQNIVGREALTLPPPTFDGDLTIQNLFSGEFPSSYEICDRTGFRGRRGSLLEEWTGMMVREKSWERRNIQDFVRGVGDEAKGSPRPEQEDRYVYEDYPQGVTADDL